MCDTQQKQAVYDGREGQGGLGTPRRACGCDGVSPTGQDFPVLLMAVPPARRAVPGMQQAPNKYLWLTDGLRTDTNYIY